VSESPTRQLADDHAYVKLVVGAMDRVAAYIERIGRCTSTDDSEDSA